MRGHVTHATTLLVRPVGFNRFIGNLNKAEQFSIGTDDSDPHWAAIPKRFEPRMEARMHGSGWFARKVQRRTEHQWTETLRLLDNEAEKLLRTHGLIEAFNEHMGRVRTGKEQLVYHDAFKISAAPGS